MVGIFLKYCNKNKILLINLTAGVCKPSFTCLTLLYVHIVVPLLKVKDSLAIKILRQDNFFGLLFCKFVEGSFGQFVKCFVSGCKNG